MTIRYNTIDTSKLTVGSVREGAKMRSFYVDYKGGPFVVQGPEMMMDWGGVPKLDDYHHKDSERQYVMYSLDAQQVEKTREDSEAHAKRKKSLEKFQDWLNEVEGWLNSDDVMNQVLDGRKGDCMPLLKCGNSGPTKVKFKFYTDKDGYGDFTVFQKQANSAIEQDSHKMTLDHLSEHVFRYMGSQQLLFQLRGWTDKLNKRNPRYGLTLIIKSVKYSNVKPAKPIQQPTTFIDSDDES